jgi:hypothetical protein
MVWRSSTPWLSDAHLGRAHHDAAGSIHVITDYLDQRLFSES